MISKNFIYLSSTNADFLVDDAFNGKPMVANSHCFNHIWGITVMLI